MSLPADPPPPAFAAAALPYLSAAVATAVPSGPSALLPPLSMALRTLARARLFDTPPPVPLAPLHAFVSLASEDPSVIPVSMVADALLAYPSETGALSTALSALLAEREAELASLVRSAPSALSTSGALLATARLLHALLRLPGAHIVLAHARELVPALVAAYDGAGVRAKAETLPLLRALLADGSLRALLPPARTGVPLVDQNATADLALFSSQSPGEVVETLRALHDDERRDDPRLQPLLNLFPALPVHLLADALAHPAFSGRAGATASEQAAPLVDAVLARTLPPDLHELRAAAASMDGGDDVAGAAGPSSPPPKAARRGGWEDVDLSKLRLKGESEGPAEIPDSLRASILRLVEAQEEEAEAAARAVAEAHGHYGSDEEEDVAPARGPVGDGEWSGDEREGEGEDGENGESRTPARKENTAQTLLELAYLQTPAVFNRDSATRRSAARADLRERTGMDDGQIEGWKVMLERNPHKDAILERHQFSRPSNSSPKPKKEQGGGGESSRGGGGGRGGRGVGGSGGRGGGRGRGASKGSRGHSNAARTRGHDKKMSRMGAGL